MRDTRVVAQVAQVEQLPGAPGTQAYKTLEAMQVLDRGELTQITLHVGGKVVGQGLRGVEVLIMDARIEPRQQDLRQVGVSHAAAQAPHLG